MPEIKFCRFKPVPIPQYQTLSASGIDLHSAQTLTLKPGTFKTIRTGVGIQMPRRFEAQVRPRSGLAAKYGIGILNSPGTIDADYRGEIKIVLFNFGKKNFKVKKGDRIAQLVFSQIVPVKLIEVKRLSKTARGTGGFGHTG